MRIIKEAITKDRKYVCRLCGVTFEDFNKKASLCVQDFTTHDFILKKPDKLESHVNNMFTTEGR